MKIFVGVCAVFLTLLNVNKSGGEESPSSNVLNVIVILDTSNRVSQKKHPGQIERDIKIVEEIATQFEKVVRNNIDQGTELEYEDSLTIVVPNQPAVPPIPWDIMEKLTIDDPGDCDICDNYKGFLEKLTQQQEALSNEMSRLYEFVGQHRQTGSDIWEWFKDEAEHYFDKGKRNLIICLSDGYLNFDRNIEAKRLPGTYMRVRELRDNPNWQPRRHDSEGLKPIEKDFSPYNVKFLMLEIVPQKDEDGIPYQRDFEIIKEYWGKWLNDMKIKDIDFIKKRGNLPTRRIKTFISGEDGS